MLIDDSTKNDIIKILEDVINPGILDYDPEWEQRLCNFCYGGSQIRLSQKDEDKEPEEFIVKHTDDCAVTVARKLLMLFKDTSNTTDFLS